MSKFFLKQVFTDITHAELQLLSKVLASRHALCHEAVLPKALAPGDKWPANQYSTRLLLVAASTLVMSRRGMPRQQIIEDQEYAGPKWGFGIPNYNGGWECSLRDHLPTEAICWLEDEGMLDEADDPQAAETRPRIDEAATSLPRGLFDDSPPF